MSGLFQRLARQAAGSESARVHTMARLPFVPPADVQTPAEGFTAIANPGSGTTASSSGLRQDAELADMPVGAMPPAPSADDGRAGMPAAVSPASAARPAGAGPAHRRANRQAAPDTGPGEGGRHVPSTIADAGSVLPTPDSRAPAMPRSGRGDEAAAVVANPSIGHVPEPIVASDNAATGHASVSAAGSMTMRTNPAGDRQRMTASDAMAGDQPAEVHVHIGRIEVTATQEAPPPKRRAAAAPKFMTLDEYLARRKREA